MFQPFRAIGHVTSDVPLGLQAMASTVFITAAVASHFHVYKANDMKLAMLANANATIKALCSYKETTFCLVENKIMVFKRQHLQYELNTEASSIMLLGSE
jgi:hypothetical protein